MKHTAKLFALIAFASLISFRVNAQTPENAGQYMDQVSKENIKVTQKYLFYLSGVSHGKSARKVEKRRIDVLNTINEARYNVMALPPWKGDRTLKDTTVAYLKLLYNVFNEDYAKIVNMEEIAEQSYDAMEAYMLAQEKAGEKLDEAAKRQNEMQRAFAKKNNVNLIEDESELETKSKIVGQVMDHLNKMYLIFFKPYKQEAYLLDAIAKKNLLSIEQNLGSLEKFAEEGLEKLKEIKGYNNDASLITACRSMMHFYKSEVKRGKIITDYFLKEEEFNKIKKQFEAKPSGKRTQQDVDQFNNAVNDINSILKDYNSTLTTLNKERSAALDEWNKTYNRYMETHIPKQQRQ